MKRLLLGVVCLFLWLPVSGEGATIAPKRFVLDHGLIVLLQERHALPFVVVHLSVPAGAYYDPQGKEGLANLAARLLTTGTATRADKEIAETIESVGGALSASAHQELATLSLTVLKKDLHLGFQLLSDILLHPSFNDKEIERERKKVLAGILQDKDEPRAVASKAFDKALFGRHPYAHPIQGWEESVPRLTREEIVAFHRERYRPERAILTAVGDVTEAEVRALAAEFFKEWKGKPYAPAAPAPLTEPQTRRMELIEKDLSQSTIVLGHLGVPRNHPDFYALQVMNYILGGGSFASRLTQNVRDNRGLVYGIYSMLDTRLRAGSIEFSLQTKNITAREALEETLREIDRIRREPVTDDELKGAKAYLIGSFPLRLDTNRKLADFLTVLELYGLGLGYIQEYPRLIGAVTKEDVLRVARKHLHPDRLLLVAVGRQEEARLPAAFAHGASYVPNLKEIDVCY